ncbi:helix-hairpin-helix domain-containing protein [Lactiplantibacillus herbarum]|uniref:helix-hairpin-helix domain-containing protein n=1 Tax=Lactiplantibacillus herbarum TaxID=1670446 RepID=UPI00064E3654|nr:helix-hairpin-helix domain-containing protein [Lactiplantibacillus herbarum]
MTVVWQLIRKQWRLVALAGGVIIILGGGWIISHVSAPQTPAPAIALSSTSQKQSHQTAASGRSRSSSGPVYVDVKGAVKRPGLYRVSASMRVADVINMAQGMQVQADEQQVNLAAKVADQQVIYVPAKGESHVSTPAQSVPAASTAPTGVASSSTSGASSATSNEPINLNQADVATLQHLSGVGQKKAEKIVAYRQQHGDFKSVDELKKVPGFGDKTVAKYKDRLVV